MKNQIITQVTTLLNSNTSGIRTTRMFKILLSHLVRWYAQVTNENRDVYAVSIDVALQTCDISERAAERIRQILGTTGLTRIEKVRKIKKELYPEHNRPVNAVVGEILELVEIDYENVKRILEEGYRVVIITREEARVLNGRTDKLYPVGDTMLLGAGLRDDGKAIERMAAIGAVYCPKKDIDTLIAELKSIQ